MVRASFGRERDSWSGRRVVAGVVCWAGLAAAVGLWRTRALAGPVTSYFTQPYPGSVPLFTSTAVSSDGMVAVGWVDNPLLAFMFDQAWILTPCATQQLADLGFGAYAFGVSDAGQVVVGSVLDPQTGMYSAVRWDAPGYGFTALPGASAFLSSEASAITPNGAVIVGTAYAGPGQGQGFFSAYGGPMVGVGSIPGYANNAFSAVAPDATAAVGYATNMSGSRAMWFRPGAGLALLPNPPGGVFQYASAVSGMPHRIVGTGVVGNVARAMISDGVTTVSLGTLPGDNVSVGLGISPDGAVVIGTSTGSGPVLPLISRTFVWTVGTGMLDLEATLTGALGYAGLGTWRLVMGRSAGWGLRSFTGTAFNTVTGDYAGYLINLCPADMNRDGATDLNDVPVFFALFNAGDCRADLNEDGAFTQGDLNEMALGLMGGC